MDLPEGFHREIIEARESQKNVDAKGEDIKNSVATTPLNPGGASFRTNVLVEESPSKLIYKPYIGAALFSLAFLIAGIVILFFGIFPFERDSENIKWLIIGAGSIFFAVGCFTLYSFNKPKVFDKQLGFYYSTYKFNFEKSTKDLSNNYIKLNRIIAIQIIGEFINSSDGHYKSFELNLVLEDGSRKNVIDHGNLKSIIDDAHVLSDFLDIPIWHATS